MKRKIIVSGVILGIFAISMIFVFPLILTSNISNKSEQSFIATEDMYWYKELVDDHYINHFFGSENYLMCGRKNATYYSGHYGTCFRFPILNRPSNWVNCEISFYIYAITGNFNNDSWLLSVYEGNWYEDIQHGWNYDWHLGNFNVSLNSGFNKINITDYMIQPEAQSNETVSLTLYPYIKGTVWSDLDVMVYIHSKEADINKTYLPQLIWS
jgi:hypothetical protein